MPVMNIACMLKCFSHVQLFPTLWTVAHQAPLPMGFSSQEHWSGLPCLSSGDLSDPGIKTPMSYISCIGREVLYHQCHLESPMNITQNVNYKSIKFVIKEKSLPNPRSSRFLYMLSIRILYFFFHIQIHILSTFAKGVSSVSEFFFFFFFFACGCPVVPTPFAEKTIFFLHCITIVPLSR